MSPPYNRSGELVSLEFDLVKAELAVEWLPRQDKEFRRARKRWTDYVRQSKLLTAAQSKIGLTIADVYINRQPDHLWFNWAWPSHQLLALKTGLTRRTVLSAVERLAELGLLKVARGGGAKGLGGRTHRYTLNMAGLGALEAQAENLDRAEDVKNLHGFERVVAFEEPQRRENCRPKVCNPLPKAVKRLRTNLKDSKGDSVTTPISSVTPVRQLPRSEGETHFDSVTSMDHTALAKCVGKGNVREGYQQLENISEDEFNALALHLKREPSAGDAIRLHVTAGLATKHRVATVPIARAVPSEPKSGVGTLKQ